MVSREFIRSVIRSNHVIAVHMKGEQRLDGLSSLIYVIHDLILDEKEEKLPTCTVEGSYQIAIR